MSPDRLSTTFAALADPTRRAILARLASGEASVSTFARGVELLVPTVNYLDLTPLGRQEG